MKLNTLDSRMLWYEMNAARRLPTPSDAPWTILLRQPDGTRRYTGDASCVGSALFRKACRLLLTGTAGIRGSDKLVNTIAISRCNSKWVIAFAEKPISWREGCAIKDLLQKMSGRPREPQSHIVAVLDSNALSFDAFPLYKGPALKSST